MTSEEERIIEKEEQEYFQKQQLNSGLQNWLKKETTTISDDEQTPVPKEDSEKPGGIQL